jgi:hypothetical protein
LNKFWIISKLNNNYFIIIHSKNYIGDWGLGIGDWGLGIGPNPQSPIPNPHYGVLKFFYLINFYIF